MLAITPCPPPRLCAPKECCFSKQQGQGSSQVRSSILSSFFCLKLHPHDHIWLVVSNILLFSPLFGEDSHFDSYFSDGLKPPTRYSIHLHPEFKDEICIEIDPNVKLHGSKPGSEGQLRSIFDLQTPTPTTHIHT